MSFRPPVRLFESAQSERPLSKTEYCLLHHVGEVCAILLMICCWNQVRLGLFVDLERYYGQALQQAEWAGFHKTSFHGNHVGEHIGYHFVKKCLDRFEATMCSITLQRIHVSDMGRQLMGSLLSPCLKMGVSHTCLGPIMRDLTWV